MAMTALQLKHSKMTFSQLQGEDPFTESSGEHIRNYMAMLAGLVADETGVTVVAPVLTLDELGANAARDALLTFDQLLGEYPEASGTKIRAYMAKLELAQADVIELEAITRAANALGLTIPEYQRVKPFLDNQAAAIAAQNAFMSSAVVVAAVDRFRASPMDEAAWQNLANLLANAPVNYIETGDPTNFQMKYGRQEYIATADLPNKYPDVALAFYAAGEKFNPQGGFLSLQNLGPALAIVAAAFAAFTPIVTAAGTAVEAGTLGLSFEAGLGLEAGALTEVGIGGVGAGSLAVDAVPIVDITTSPLIDVAKQVAPDIFDQIASPALEEVGQLIPAEIVSSPAIETITVVAPVDAGLATIEQAPTLMDTLFGAAETTVKAVGTAGAVVATGAKVAETIQGAPEPLKTNQPGATRETAQPVPEQKNDLATVILLGVGALAFFA